MRIRLLAVAAAFSIVFSTGYAKAATFNVDCDAALPPPGVFQTIQAALDAAAEGDTIEVSGTCNESITIRNDHTVVDGQSVVFGGVGGAKIIVPVASGDRAVSIRADFVTIVGFSEIIGERQGISVSGNNQSIRGNTIKDSDSHTIILTSNASASIRDNVITNSGFHGIRVARGANATIQDNTITGSRRHGIQLSEVSSGEIEGNTITDNGRNGLTVSANAAVRLRDAPNVFERNGGSGIACSTGGSLDLDTAPVFGTGADANAEGDISVSDTCVIKGDAAESLGFKPEKFK
ncbi:MAG: right-handed parallel beta-helix repeat-containing protein [Gemmatimonadetes bacterium]|nr:right-handed parallel beta-helix repeat-containing protein [Gemmatimonadota bacterium]